MREQVLCIVGSVTLTGNTRALQIIEGVLDRYKPLRVISGCADGIDTMAQQAAERRGIDFTGYPPTTNRWHDGYKPRNLKMAQDCTRLIRIVDYYSKTYGSGWTRDRAKELGKPTEQFVIKPELTRY
jgi:hypothetical protein